MRLLFWLLLLFVLAIAVSVAGNYSPGYALLVYPPWQAELSLTLLAALLFAGFFVAYVAVRLAVATLSLPESVRAWRRGKREEAARTRLLEALRAWIEGRPAQAEKLAVEVLEGESPPAAAALLAARAAQDVRAFERRDAHLARALELDATSAPACDMLRAEGLVDERRAEEALTLLRRIKEVSPRHSAALRLELRALAQAGRWDELETTLAPAEKARLLDAGALREYAIRVREERLARLAKQGDRALMSYWKSVPDEVMREPRVALAAARAFRDLGGEGMAADILEQALQAGWDARLLQAYGDTRGDDLPMRIGRAEGWLVEHPRDAALLLALGQLSARQKLWGKARGYLDASLAIEATADAHLALADLLESSGEKPLACDHYRKALALYRAGSAT